MDFNCSEQIFSPNNDHQLQLLHRLKLDIDYNVKLLELYSCFVEKLKDEIKIKQQLQPKQFDQEYRSLMEKCAKLSASDIYETMYQLFDSLGKQILSKNTSDGELHPETLNCNESLEDYSNLGTNSCHIIMNEDDSTEITNYQFCNDITGNDYNSSDYDDRVISISDEELDQELPKKDIENKITIEFRCDFYGCTYTTDKMDSLKRHKTNHIYKDRFKCDLLGCSYSTSRKYNLQRHKLLHKGQFQCAVDGCKFVTNWLKHFERHKLRHNLRKPKSTTIEECQSTPNQIPEKLGNVFKCKHCRFETNNQDYLKEHALKHNRDDNRPNMFKCDLKKCAFTTNLVDQLVSHKLSHHSKLKS